MSNQKLDKAQVLEIRERRSEGETLQSIADAFGISHTTVGRISRGQQWQEVGGERVYGCARTARLDSDPESVYLRWESGENYSQIAAALGVSRGVVGEIVKALGGRRRRNLQIIDRWLDGETHEEIGADFGITGDAVGYIIRKSRGGEI